MEARIIGLKGSGKSTLLGALSEGRAEGSLATVKMGDPRVRALSEIFHPKKTTFAEFRVMEVPWAEATGRKGEMDKYLDAVAGGQVYLHVVRAFESPYLAETADPERDLAELDEQFLLADLLAIERAFERAKKAPLPDQVKRFLLRAQEALEAGTPLRELDLGEGDLSTARNYQFLTLAPQVVLLNSDADGQAAEPPAEALRDRQLIAFPFTEAMEVARLSPEEQLEFAEALGLPGPAADIVSHAAFTQMGYISFFTVGEDEVRGWPIHRGEHARQAAGVIHSDLERGFIRAEVVAYDDFMRCGQSMKGCRDAGTLKVEGKDYVVQDGDILHVRFNV